MSRNSVILATLLGVLSICLAYAYLATPRLEKAPPREKAQQVRASKANVKPGEVRNDGRIDFSFLERGEEEYPGAKRDIFRFGQKRPTRKIKSIPVAEKVEAQPVEVVVDIPEVTPIEVVQKSLSRFTFLGFLDKRNEKTVFLSSGGELFLVKQGDAFGLDQEFYVNSIEGDLLKVKHSGREMLIEIPLVEKKKLAAAVSSPASIAPSPNESQMNNRIFRPKNMSAQPVVAPENEEPFRELIEEYNPQDEQGESPAKEGAVEGEVDGTNQ